MRFIFLSLLLTGVACKKPVPPPPPPPVVEPEPEPVKTVEKAVEVIIRNFERVHFDYDSASLAGESKAALETNAGLMQDFPNIRVEIQGHADDRGTTDYNLALGQKRARSIANYLGNMGVPESRLPVVSYGEERPVASGSDEVAWSQNRRAEFRLLGVAEGLQGTID
jgi:peptidoglycan-associated lipoprotein